jgi:hypothetical protein
MRKTLLAFLILAISFSFSSCGSDPAKSAGKSESEKRGLKGNVKSVWTKQLDSTETIDQYSEDSYSLVNFAASGIITEELFYQNKEEISKAVYKTDEKGFYVSRDAFSKGKLSFHTDYKIGDDGNIAEEKHILPDGKLSYLVSNTYDGKGNMTEENIRLVHSAPGCRAPGKIKYENDTSGYFLKQITCDSTGNAIWTYEVKRDAAGNITATPGERYDYVFDEKGNWIVRTTHYMKDPMEKEVITIRRITYY